VDWWRDQSPLGIEREISGEAIAGAVGIGSASVIGQGVPPREGGASFSEAISGESRCGLGALGSGGSTIGGVSEKGHGVGTRIVNDSCAT